MFAVSDGANERRARRMGGGGRVRSMSGAGSAGVRDRLQRVTFWVLPWQFVGAGLTLLGTEQAHGRAATPGVDLQFALGASRAWRVGTSRVVVPVVNGW